LRILIATTWIPFPPESGSLRRTWELAQRLARHHEVSFALPIRWPDEDLEKISAIERAGFRVIARPGVARSRLTNVLRGRPSVNAERGSPALEREIARLSTERAVDVVQIEHQDFGDLPYDLPGNGARVAAHMHDVLSESYARMAAVEKTGRGRFMRRMDAAAFRRLEHRLVTRADLTVVVSDRERARLATVGDAQRILVVPNGTDLSEEPLPEATNAAPVLLFVGHMHYLPNVDAASWLVESIFPRVRDMFPAARLVIAGGEPPAGVRLDGEGVEVAGFVSDLRACYARADVVVVPVRAGGGTRIKILEAMAQGRPVVSTSLGAEGLDVDPQTHLLVADAPQTIADAVAFLVRNADQRRRMVAAARAFVERHHSWDDSARRLHQAYEMFCEPRAQR
jgi:glycosyltransferase involved in cell wall biosynthesis